MGVFTTPTKMKKGNEKNEKWFTAYGS